MTELAIPPGLVLILAGLLLPLLNAQLRAAVIAIAPLITLALVWNVPDGNVLTISWLGYELVPLAGDNLSRMFGTVFAIMALIGGIFALNQARVVELAAAFVYAGSAVGVVFAGDLITVFVFWELMAIGSTLVIMSNGDEAFGPGMRYAVIHFFGGVVLMAGIAGEIATTGSIAFHPMQTDSVFRWLILFGFVINTGAPPLHPWLPDAYPKSSWSGMVFLSAFTTKTAVYTLIRGFPGAEVLIWVGLFMIFYGLIYALNENDTRRKLAYSIINQVGFMVCATGIGNEMALNGAAAHAFVHIIYKALLLMSAGSVLYVTGISKFTRLGGLFRSMPMTTICCIIGALSISATPFTSGFPAKSLIAGGAAEAHMPIVWFLLTGAVAGVLIVAIKLPWFIFFQKDSGLRPPEPPLSMRLAMYAASALCIGLGIFPGVLYSMLPHATDYNPYTGGHLASQFQLLLAGTIVFFALLKWLKRTETISLDVDWFWRGFGKLLAREFDVRTGVAWQGIASNVSNVVQRFVKTIYKHHGPEGMLARTWPTGLMAFWTTVLLAATLILAYV